LSAPSSTYRIPRPSQILRRGDGGIGNGDDPLASTKAGGLAGLPESDAHIATHRRPLKHDNRIEPRLRGAHRGPAAIDLELVRLHGNLKLPGAGIRTGEPRLDELDVGIRVVDPDRGCASALTCLS
jgi:hypothetical protein